MKDLSILHERANEALTNGDKERALEIYKEILAESPTDEVALIQLMEIYYDTDKELYYLTRADLNISNMKYEHAINDCKKAISLDANSLDANLKLARLYRVTKKNLRAIDVFSHIIEFSPETLVSYKELAELYLLEDSAQSALNTLLRVGDWAKGDEKKYFENFIAKIYFDLGEYELALEKVQDDILRIKILLQKGDNSRAKEILDRFDLNKISKELRATYYSLIAQYYYNNHEWQNALESVDKYAEEKAPDAVSFQMKALIYEEMGKNFESALNWGFCNKVQNKLEEAIVEFNHAYQINPKDKTTLIELANLYKKTGERFIAIEFWQKVYELDGDESAKQILGDFYFDEGDYPMAEKYGKVRETLGNDNAPIEEDEGLIGKIMKFFQR